MHTALLKYMTDSGKLYAQMLVPARKAFGLTQVELDILLFLANNPEYDTASDIVAIRHLAKSNVSVGIRSLEAKGLIHRRADGRDRRVDHLELTAAAQAPVELGQEGQQRFKALLFQGFSAEDRAELERLMGRIQQNISQVLDTWTDHRKEGKSL